MKCKYFIIFYKYVAYKFLNTFYYVWNGMAFKWLYYGGRESSTRESFWIEV